MAGFADSGPLLEIIREMRTHHPYLRPLTDGMPSTGEVVILNAAIPLEAKAY